MTQLETPTDQVPVPSEGKPPRKVAKRGTRKRVLGSGEGDYCIYEIVGPGGELPTGALLPIPNIPRFPHTVQAVRWIQKESGDLLAGKQVMIFRAMEILNLRLETKPRVVIEGKPKIVVTDPTKPAAS